MNQLLRVLRVSVVNIHRFGMFDPMTEIDPLIRLLQTADAAADLPKAAGDLPDQVRRLRAQRAKKSKQIRFASLAVAAVLLASISIYALKPPAPPGGGGRVDDQTALIPRQSRGLTGTTLILPVCVLMPMRWRPKPRRWNTNSC